MRRSTARPSLVDATFACRSFLLRFRNRRTLRTARVGGRGRPHLLASVGGKLRFAGLDHGAHSKLLPCEACSRAIRNFHCEVFRTASGVGQPAAFLYAGAPRMPAAVAENVQARGARRRAHQGAARGALHGRVADRTGLRYLVPASPLSRNDPAARLRGIDHRRNMRAARCQRRDGEGAPAPGAGSRPGIYLGPGSVLAGRRRLLRESCVNSESPRRAALWFVESSARHCLRQPEHNFHCIRRRRCVRLSRNLPYSSKSRHKRIACHEAGNRDQIICDCAANAQSPPAVAHAHRHDVLWGSRHRPTNAI